MTNKILIKNALIIDPLENKEIREDVRIEGEEIVERGASLKHAPTDEELIDANGCWLCPGLIDMHTHLRDLGQKDKEDIHTGTKAAAAGGFTTVVSMANTDPVLDNGATLSLYLQKIKARAVVEVLPVASVTKGLLGQELSNMLELSELGAIAFSDDGKPVQNMTVLRRALEYARLTCKIIISHAEDLDLSEGGSIHECELSTSLGLQGISYASETVAVARELEIVRLTGAAYHFTHLSCASSVELIRRARSEGLAVTADVTPHHLALTVDNLGEYETNYKMNPPLRSKKDQAALISALQDGTISAIATDHAPHTHLEKSRTFTEAPFGITGLETAFSVVYTTLVKAQHITKMNLIQLLTVGPAKILNLPMPSLAIGSRANLCIIDPEVIWTYDAKNGQSRSSNSPWDTQELSGRVNYTIYKGSIVYRSEQLVDRKIAAR